MIFELVHPPFTPISSNEHTNGVHLKETSFASLCLVMASPAWHYPICIEAICQQVELVAYIFNKYKKLNMNLM
jgi:hypothetical protein